MVCLFRLKKSDDHEVALFHLLPSCRGISVAPAICNRSSSFSHLIFCSFSSASAFFCANDRRVLLHHLFHSNWRGLHQAIGFKKGLITNFCMKSLWPPKGCSKCINNLVLALSQELSSLLSLLIYSWFRLQFIQSIDWKVEDAKS